MRILLTALATTLIAFFTLSSVAQAMDEELPSCFVTGEGLYRGAWVKHRIYINEDVVYGANDMGAILNQLEALREQGSCR